MAIAEEHMITVEQLASRFNKPRWLVEEKIRILLEKRLLSLELLGDITTPDKMLLKGVFGENGINYDIHRLEALKDRGRGFCALKCGSCSKGCVDGFTADIKIFSLTEKGCEFIYGRRERNAKK